MRRRQGHRSVAARGALAMLACATLVAPTLVLVGATAQPAAAEGLALTSTTTYVVDPAARAVHVTVDATATNTTPDQRRGNIIDRAYYKALVLLTQNEAVNFSAVSDSGQPLAVTLAALPGSGAIATEVDVHFSSNLFANQTQGVHLHYDLPDGAPRSNSLTRVTAAFASFGAYPNAGDGTESVVIVVPRSFSVDLLGENMTRQSTGATVTYSASNVANPEAWYVTVSARDDSNLVGKDLIVDDHPVRIRAFPDDPLWESFVAGRVAKGLPQLERLIGLPWPAANQLLITETVTPYLYGYAGWYSRTDNTIEVGDALDAQVVLHEISHVWFNDLLFNTRWIDEGLAQEYAARAVAAMGGKLALPKAVNLRAPAAIPLEQWSTVDLQAQNSRARETFGYNASWSVIHALADEIGVDGMRRVFAAASKRAMPYLGTDNPGAVGGAGSWKRFLDYLDETGGSKKADAIFAKYVAPPSDTLLAQRTQTRGQYAQLLRTSRGWKAPLVVRQAMTKWDFTTAQTLIGTAEQVTSLHAEIERTLAPLGLHAPAKLQADYEHNSSDLAAVQKEAATDLAAAKDLAAASTAVHGHHGLFATIGSIGSRDTHDLSSARRSFASGNAATARDNALAASHLAADASSTGRLRSAVALGVIVLLALAVWLLRRRRSRRRARRAGSAPLGTGLTGADGGPANGEVVAGPAG
jgi:hypothetical protein